MRRNSARRHSELLKDTARLVPPRQMESAARAPCPVVARRVATSPRNELPAWEQSHAAASVGDGSTSSPARRAANRSVQWS